MIPITPLQGVQIYNNDYKAVPFLYSRAAAVTKSDTTVLEPGIVYAGGTGDLVVALENDPSTWVTFYGVPAGTFLPLRVVKVGASSSTTNMVICY